MSSRYAEREEAVRGRYERLAPTLDERSRRLFAANEATQFGYGGVAAVQRATGLAASTIQRGKKELTELDSASPPDGKLRRPGAGRKRKELVMDGLAPALRRLVEPATRGDPESPLLWTSKSTVQLAKTLKESGYPVGPTTVRRLLKQEGFTLQAARKTLEGADHEHRNQQFERIYALIEAFQQSGQPTISVDTKGRDPSPGLHVMRHSQARQVGPRGRAASRTRPTARRD